MKAWALVSCILLSIFVLLFLSTAVQATEYREVDATVKADDILKHIENGDDVNLSNCRIVGELNLSRIELETVPNPLYNKFKPYSEEVPIIHGGRKGYYYSEVVNNRLKVINSKITILNSSLEEGLNFSNALFKKSLSFVGVKCYSKSTFQGSAFNGSAHFEKSTFYSKADFSCMTFNDTAEFLESSFMDNVFFAGSILNGTTSFSKVDFRDDASFCYVIFNNDISFDNTHFRQYADFEFATFNSVISLWVVDFNKNAAFVDAYFNNVDFSNAYFFGEVLFWSAAFNGNVNFWSSNFYNSASFSGTTFNETANFVGPDFGGVENIVTDGVSSQPFMKYYKSKGRYEDADTIYYNYRSDNQARKEWYEISKWLDCLSWLTCGYGVRPLHAFIFGTIIIFLFSLIYMNPISLHKNRFWWVSFRLSWNVFFEKSSNKTIPFKLTLKNPGIVKWVPFRLSWNVFFEKSSNKAIPFKLTLKNPGIVKNGDRSQMASLLDLFYYSICRFTFMSYENWYPKDNFRIFTIVEGILGWATLGIFMATLTAVMIRI